LRYFGVMARADTGNGKASGRRGDQRDPAWTLFSAESADFSGGFGILIIGYSYEKRPIKLIMLILLGIDF
jgi:hypothetical protein